MIEVREDLASHLGESFNEPLDCFFLRHVEVRWLEMLICLQRLESLWESTKEFFLVFLPNSQSASDKKALQTKKFKTIAEFLKGSNEKPNYLRVKFLIFVCKLFR